MFLYARCAVVAAGQAVWESVFFDADKFAPYTSSECAVNGCCTCRTRRTSWPPARGGTA
ncbi:hypothetical protein [Streptomyces sp. NPDC127092]|uniref:hypothetical protein n=1 Tax=Streptomyces sp. NPDC127092 TaxID=3347135 RepID=UPI003649EFC9